MCYTPSVPGMLTRNGGLAGVLSRVRQRRPEAIEHAADASEHDALRRSRYR